ncbi:MAG: cell division topological specificity factor MinE [Lachnospiraceae bacterium]|nr:cell division topological specificity factor MinE [Lachnospiraceae bacterium]
MHRYGKKTFLTSREIAKARTELTVSADRLDSNPDLLVQMRHDVAEVLSKYINTEEENLEIRISFLCRWKRGISDVKTIQIK